VEPTDAMLPGHVSLPNGLGLSVAEPDHDPVRTGTAPNELTAADDRDEWAGTRGTSTYRPGSNPADPTRGHR
jgi:hypothetical protein